MFLSLQVILVSWGIRTTNTNYNKITIGTFLVKYCACRCVITITLHQTTKQTIHQHFYYNHSLNDMFLLLQVVLIKWRTGRTNTMYNKPTFWAFSVQFCACKCAITITLQQITKQTIHDHFQCIDNVNGMILLLQVILVSWGIRRTNSMYNKSVVWAFLCSSVHEGVQSQ